FHCAQRPSTELSGDLGSRRKQTGFTGYCFAADWNAAGSQFQIYREFLRMSETLGSCDGTGGVKPAAPQNRQTNKQHYSSFRAAPAIGFGRKAPSFRSCG